jgi:hypothetical protein
LAQQPSRGELLALRQLWCCAGAMQRFGLGQDVALLSYPAFELGLRLVLVFMLVLLFGFLIKKVLPELF